MPTWVDNMVSGGVDYGYKTNTALDRHTASAHEGKVDQDCPACIEIQAKMARLKEAADVA